LYDYDSGTTFIKSYENTGNLGNRWIANVDGVDALSQGKVAKPNGTFLLYRQKDKDLVTLYPEKNDGLLSKLNGLGITSVSYTPAGTRAEKEMQKDSYFTNHFQTYFEYTEHHTSLFSTWYRRKCNKSNDTWYESITITTPNAANDYYSGASGNTQNVKEWYYVGESNSGLSDTSDSWNNSVDSFYNKYKYNRKSAVVSSELKFYPYAKMIYRDKNANSNKQSVYVTSENLSTMKVFNAVQAGIYKKNEINANLTSTQWSTHARSLSFLQNKGISDKKSVLPGGAIQDIDMGTQGDTKLGIKLWQACLPDAQVQAVQDGFKVSESEAKSAADTLKSEIEKTINGYGLVQYGIEGVKLDYLSIIGSGDELHEDTSVDFVLGNGGNTSPDDKYYLRRDGTGSNRANFDCLGSRIDKQVLYTIKSDTDGNVMLYKDGTEIAKISKTQSASDMIAKSAEIKLLDDNTKLVTNYISAIDRNKGESNKYDRYNQNKYNEAFDGVSVLMTDMSFDIGFGSGNSHRTNVLDPLLTAKTESKSDLYNFTEDSKVRSSVYVTTLTSTTSSNKNAGYMGTLKGISGIGDLEVSLSDIQSMVYTKNFYIPNANVSDLN
jgi:hypothetical protein